MTTISKNIASHFTSGINTDKLRREINEELEIDPTIMIHGNSVDIEFQSTLTAGQVTTIDNIISLHNPADDIPMEISTTIAPNDTYYATHFYDSSFNRLCCIQEDTNDTYDESTKFVFTDTFNADYTITNPSNAHLSDVAFTLIGAGFQEGSNIAGNGTASASSSTQPASNAIDNNTGTFWYNNTSEPAVGSWWKIDFGSITGIYGCEVMWYSTTYYGTDVSIHYSNDDVNWTLGLRDTNVTYTSVGNSTGRYKFASFSSPIFARYFRFTCNASNNSTYFIFKEVYMYQAVANGFSTTLSSTLTNKKENRQLDTSNYDHINSSTIIGSFPANTSTKILLSFDNQSTWVYWNGSAWTSTSLANINTNFMTHTTFNSLTQANYASANGFNSGTETIDIAINISTSVSTSAPIILNLVFNVTTNNFRQQISDNVLRIRYISPIKTEFKNLTDESKNIVAKLWLE